MSETQVLAPSLIDEMQKINKTVESDVELVSAKTNELATIPDEDLEDGEIDDDDEDVSNDVIAVSVIKTATTTNTSSTNTASSTTTNATAAKTSDAAKKSKLPPNDKSNKNADSFVTIELSDDNGLSPKTQSTKNKKQKPLEDDHLSSIEHALANALKKKGIEPIAPALQTHVNDDNDEKHNGQHSSSRSSRRRKRKKQRDEKEKSKSSHSDKKKGRYDSPEPSQKPIRDVVELDDDMDDYEMLNVRGGSPPLVRDLPMPALLPPNFNDQQQQSDYESDYSYDSYESANDGDSPRNDSRRKRRNKKDKKRRDRGSRNEKSHRRRESPERQEPRRMELCKFYLLECCAKHDKCSYMHGDFPCKYYYLGMDCNEKDDCKFSHGEPLTEQLRNILIKHLEMAPKEILGNFKRIPRDQAISMITKRHEELCKKYKVENSWSNLNSSTSNFQRAGGKQQQQQQQKQLKQNNGKHQQQPQQQQQMHQQQHQHQQNVAKIPSLLDMVIKPPMELNFDIGNSTPPHDSNNIGRQSRKSRWNDANSSSSVNEHEKKNSTSSAMLGPSYLDLKNLNGILSDEHISALSSSGIVNLEQVNQLTVGQLNQIGLTIGEINEIQLKAKNMAMLGGANVKMAAATSELAAKSSPKTEMSTTQSASNAPAILDKKSKAQQLQDTELFSTNSNSNSNSAVVMVDYTQYLKDSHLPFVHNDDDERDDEQLVIDDGHADNDENPFGSSPSKSEMKRKDSQSDSEQQQQQLQMSDFGRALKNPFGSLSSSNRIGQDPRLSTKQQHGRTATNAFGVADTDSDDERYYASRGRRSRSTTPPPRSGSSTPEASQSPRLEEFGASLKAVKLRENPKYERVTMYDFNVKSDATEDETRNTDKDMRFSDGVVSSSIAGDIDLRLPFVPVTNYTPATEIDGSITSHLPINYKVYIVDVKQPSYTELRRNFKSDQTSDPRLRRILGLPETSQTRTAAAVLRRNTRKLSNTIASPESSDGASPKYYTPPTAASSSATEETISRKQPQQQQQQPSAVPTQQLRVDPRRAARQQSESKIKSPPIAESGAASAPAPTPSNNAVKQNIEIRNHLQKSDWYKNLNSKFKIMVNQQLALVSTELKKFHQDPSPNKIFDISFIVNNATLQQILTQLGVYIDDNGEVAHIDGDEDDDEKQQGVGDTNVGSSTSSSNTNVMLPNLSQPPPMQQQQQQQHLDFLRGPPPNVLHNQGQINMPPQFSAPPPIARPSLLGMPPVAPPRNNFNPFAQNMPVMNPFANAPSLLGPGPGVPPNVAFNNPFNNPMNMPPQQQQRNFGNQLRNQRNQRRNNNHGDNNNGSNI